MPTVRFIHNSYLNDDGTEHIIGGVQTYMKNLILVYKQKGYNVVIYQFAKKSFLKEADGAVVRGINCKKNAVKYLVKEAENEAAENDFLVFATDFNITKNKFKKAIAIQHGVAWDITSDVKCSDFANIINIFKDSVRACIKYIRFKHCTDIVCVDYNFINWYRTKVKHIDVKLHTIPNFTDIPQKKIYNNSSRVSIIFARRFQVYRGTRLFTEVIKGLLDNRDDIDITIAGEGPDETWLKKNLDKYKNVKFMKFEAKDSLEIHRQYDIAVVPTIGSEGTSLSLLEAMAAGCAVIATNVGGMTNIILDGYNGIMINPDRQELNVAINILINNFELRKKISEKAYETVKSSFSLDKWRDKWLDVIEEVENR